MPLPRISGGVPGAGGGNQDSGDVQGAGKAGSTSSSSSSSSSKSGVSKRSSDSSIDGKRLKAAENPPKSPTVAAKIVKFFRGGSPKPIPGGVTGGLSSSKLSLSLTGASDFGESSTDDTSGASRTPPPLPPERPASASGVPQAPGEPPKPVGAGPGGEPEPLYIDPSELNPEGGTGARMVRGESQGSGGGASSSSSSSEGPGGPDGAGGPIGGPGGEESPYLEFGADGEVRYFSPDDLEMGDDDVFVGGAGSSPAGDGSSDSLDSQARARVSIQSSFRSELEALSELEAFAEAADIDPGEAAGNILGCVLRGKEVPGFMTPVFPEGVGGKMVGTGKVEALGLVVCQKLTGPEETAYRFFQAVGAWLGGPNPSPDNAPRDVRSMLTGAEMRSLVNHREGFLSTMPIPLAMGEDSGNTAVVLRDPNKLSDGQGGYRSVSSSGCVDIKLGSSAHRGELELHYPGANPLWAAARSGLVGRIAAAVRGGAGLRGFEVVRRGEDANRLPGGSKGLFSAGLGDTLASLSRLQMIRLEQQVKEVAQIVSVLPMACLGSSVRIQVPDPGDLETTPQVTLTGFRHTVSREEVFENGEVNEAKFRHYRNEINEGMSNFMGVLSTE